MYFSGILSDQVPNYCFLPLLQFDKKTSTSSKLSSSLKLFLTPNDQQLQILSRSEYSHFTDVNITTVTMDQPLM